MQAPMSPAGRRTASRSMLAAQVADERFARNVWVKGSDAGHKTN